MLIEMKWIDPLIGGGRGPNDLVIQAKECLPTFTLTTDDEYPLNFRSYGRFVFGDLFLDFFSRGFKLITKVLSPFITIALMITILLGIREWLDF